MYIKWFPVKIIEGNINSIAYFFKKEKFYKKMLFT